MAATKPKSTPTTILAPPILNPILIKGKTRYRYLQYRHTGNSLRALTMSTADDVGSALQQRLNPFARNETDPAALFSPLGASVAARVWHDYDIALRAAPPIDRAEAIASGLFVGSLGVAFGARWNFSSLLAQHVKESLLLHGNLQERRLQLAFLHDDHELRPIKQRQGITQHVHPWPSLDSNSLHNAAGPQRSMQKAGMPWAGVDEAANELERLGVFRFDGAAWGLRNALGSDALRHLDAVHGGKATAVSSKGWSPHLQGVGSSLRHVVGLALARFRSLAEAYLGQVEVSSINMLRLPARELSTKEYVSGIHHHDRCGRRLKCFVFASNVTEDSHPPEVVIGSHKTLYYTNSPFECTRFAEAEVQQRFATRRLLLLGGVGDGFCFDTNSVHRGTPFGARRRDVLVFQLDQVGTNKAALLRRGMLPCYSHHPLLKSDTRAGRVD